MKIEKNIVICLRKEYIQWYNSKSEIKITNPNVKVIDIDQDVNFEYNYNPSPYLIIDHNNHDHKIGWEDIDFKSSKRLKLRLSIYKSLSFIRNIKFPNLVLENK